MQQWNCAALLVLLGPLTSMSGSVSGLAGELMRCFCFIGLLVEGLKVPDDDPLCRAALMCDF